jgi:hypothetical protein
MFTVWKQEQELGNIQISSTKFGLEMKEYKGIEKGKSSNGTIVYTINTSQLKEYLIKKKYYEDLPIFID